MFLFALNNYPVRCYFEIVWLFYFPAVLHALGSHSQFLPESVFVLLSQRYFCLSALFTLWHALEGDIPHPGDSLSFPHCPLACSRQPQQSAEFWDCSQGMLHSVFFLFSPQYYVPKNS